ncbi:MAG: macro domain-containing protein [Promethearchaeota archaeon]|nr:MAG: macro domain-containing protein [Candidatus Lokiarchaeota archaeon]
MMKHQLGRFTIELAKGDITGLRVDAIVNAANTQLILGSGVAGAIRQRGGPSIQMECNKLAPINTGEAVITGGGSLLASFVLHAVGPIYHQYEPHKAEELLEDAVLNSLNFIRLNELKSIALPAISAGVYGFPAKKCAEIMMSACFKYIEKYSDPDSDTPVKIILCLYDQNMYDIFQKAFEWEIEKRK